MKALSQLVIAVFELAEAEGRDLRASVRIEARAARTALIHFSLALAVLVLAVLLLAGGAWLMVSGLHLFLQTQVSRPLAAALAGLSGVATGGGCIALYRMMTRTDSQ